ncbi:serine hydrolase domain-containing protein [Paenibacillus nasutitermitis]|uniref:Beta-lactamase-related domain-containing protein n=1 Tax=Paenibacillus nasutitermitis TaxID=1652958 RepID=A0A916ZD56_9BACL|nr:serine hydrolase domain-containing protein [Paenibacillus nasutitermitis]GGD89215.1 hypothetical protein GCM10010911_54790 [Paenibacillus nasutitermitis]
MTKFNPAHWQERLDRLRAANHVPGASLAVLINGEIYELASGVLHRGTGVSVTTDSVFQVGSITKIYTATLVMQLAESGELDLDAPVIDVLPEFETPDKRATETITIRQLLSHTSGLTCDFTHDTGRGDDCLARYVEASKDIALDCPPGMAISYSSVGYNVLGRIIEVVTGQTWDDALKDRLCTPLGLNSTVTLPEDVLRFQSAMGHLGLPGQDPEPCPTWNSLPRSAGPYGGVLCATSADVVRLAKMHIDGGTALNGTRVLDSETVTAMQTREVNCMDKWSFSSDGWGLGWSLYDWEGVFGFGHDGATIGQYSYLRVVPEAGIAIVLLTNGGGAYQLYTSLFQELLNELAGVKIPDSFRPPEKPVSVNVKPFLGTYKREGSAITITERGGEPHLVWELVDGNEGFAPPLETNLVPVSDTVFAAFFGENWIPVLFSVLPDGTEYVLLGMRVAQKIA